jgi:hypothetical protein
MNTVFTVCKFGDFSKSDEMIIAFVYESDPNTIDKFKSRANIA